ncbi:hypothetical protein KKC44_05815 [Patescibacteria group bacterium]|nr:hypothetical protein [Patescibacteria group bacterium]MBU2260089.1 hypothetical protein [Patescibacteria group bacterium]
MNASQQSKRDPRFNDPGLRKERSAALKGMFKQTGFDPKSLASIMVQSEDEQRKLTTRIQRYAGGKTDIPPLRFCVLAEKALGAEEGKLYVQIHEKEKELFGQLKNEHSLSGTPAKKAAKRKSAKKAVRRKPAKKRACRKRRIRTRETASVPESLARQRSNALRFAMQKAGLDNSYQVARKAHPSGSREVRSLDMKLRRVLKGQQPLSELFAVEIAPLLGVAPSDLIVTSEQEGPSEPAEHKRSAPNGKRGRTLNLHVGIPELGLQESTALVYSDRKFVPEERKGDIVVSVDGTLITVQFKLPAESLLHLFLD